MSLHPRLGAESSARCLSEDSDPPALFRRIFSFLECYDVAKCTCIVACRFPAKVRAEGVRVQLLAHVNILQCWRRPPKEWVQALENEPQVVEGDAGAAAAATVDDAASDNSGATPAEPGPAAASTEQAASAAPAVPEVAGSEDPNNAKGTTAAVKPVESAPSALLWVMLDIPLDTVISRAVENNPVEAVEEIKWTDDGLRTGLFPKEQLLLQPFLPRRVVSVLKYVPHCDQRLSARMRPGAGVGPGLDPEGQPHRADVWMRPPSIASVPLPAFGSRSGPEKAPAPVAPVEMPTRLATLPSSMPAPAMAPQWYGTPGSGAPCNATTGGTRQDRSARGAVPPDPNVGGAWPSWYGHGGNQGNVWSDMMMAATRCGTLPGMESTGAVGCRGLLLLLLSPLLLLMLM
eukprot:NODE_3932_length_1959_cov_5.504913.p1 GENE.NODE_3932_length_1959_cov_5.504913~~NODE_3932_length_1959_cov_5.504913.p1  ORF type:complete len:403 (+),score=65.96 NODE_3932_length_1959_cov_5.504913:260-1468(+)